MPIRLADSLSHSTLLDKFTELDSAFTEMDSVTETSADSSVNVTPFSARLKQSPRGDRLCSQWRALLIDQNLPAVVLGLGMCVVPVSIALTESLLAVALALRIISLICSPVAVSPPRVFWFWLTWSAVEILSWLRSHQMLAGWGEMRHLMLVGASFLLLPALKQSGSHVAVWRGIFVSATVSSLFLIGKFGLRSLHYLYHPVASIDPVVYLRSGGLLNHWMVYSTVEILVFAALLEFS